ncbi:MAG: 50S ribosomal protein L22 [bacterium]
MKAELTGYNQAPRKVRLVTDMVKGKTVEAALAALTFFPKRAAEPIAKLIKSAAANAKQQGVEEPMKLVVKNIEVNSSGMLTRFRARAMGRSATIRHRKSRVAVTLA